ncbi:hypothetical protein BU036_09175 [Staphylococcus simulans]|uniref:hypothetical protein n=1 Tax=Staphylococcus simulans TaxID=1286 RepID=UPI000D0A14DE|nr:hypothetical protein [Staphylococcus simulans]AVO02334.1 hypothetical protein BI282_07930 [Staphylococcus simulans]AVO05280.1 hypothetical protein BI283_07895 [Staphylococcus simulans]AWG18883.1 hypothetical protein A9958_07940 [Staphylococcus simulans]AWI01830.1 hypothetical protein A7X73_07825 [Staphylococcus simulans]PTI99616.1 hypothetical protein BU048_06275 [Staphylococcus simulans]
MTKEYITISLETYDNLIRSNERKNIQIEDLQETCHNLRIELEDLEATIEELERKLASYEQLDEIDVEGSLNIDE